MVRFTAATPLPSDLIGPEVLAQPTPVAALVTLRRRRLGGTPLSMAQTFDVLRRSWTHLGDGVMASLRLGDSMPFPVWWFEFDAAAVLDGDIRFDDRTPDVVLAVPLPHPPPYGEGLIPYFRPKESHATEG